MHEYDFNDFSDEALDKFILEAYQERGRRVNANKEKLVDAFKKAFNNLCNAGYEVSIESHYIFNFEDFEIN